MGASKYSADSLCAEYSEAPLCIYNGMFIANPSFDPLRGEPRYVAVMEKLKNPKKIV